MVNDVHEVDNDALCVSIAAKKQKLPANYICKQIVFDCWDTLFISEEGSGTVGKTVEKRVKERRWKVEGDR